MPLCSDRQWATVSKNTQAQWETLQPSVNWLYDKKEKALICSICQYAGKDNPTMINFKLPIWCYWRQNWEDMPWIGSCELIGGGSIVCSSSIDWFIHSVIAFFIHKLKLSVFLMPVPYTGGGKTSIVILEPSVSLSIKWTSILGIIEIIAVIMVLFKCKGFSSSYTGETMLRLMQAPIQMEGFWHCRSQVSVYKLGHDFVWMLHGELAGGN